MAVTQGLPGGISVLERGWLSANNILFHGGGRTALVDSGYVTHAQQTVALVRQALAGKSLDLLVNTHLHSDHCGGNAALQLEYPAARTLVPPGMAEHVRHWDPVALTYVPTGQQCPRFRLDGLLKPNTDILLGERPWQVHGAPGHDPHSVILFEPQSGVLISADALWANGFGIVFQELEGQEAFDEVGATLDVIESLRPRVVIPGHGPVFTDFESALAAARRRLDGFVQDPTRHAAHAAKVLLKFKLLELQRQRMGDLQRWAAVTPYVEMVHRRWFSDMDLEAWIKRLADDLVRTGAARRDGEWLQNA